MQRVQIVFGNLEVGSGCWLSLGTRKASGGLQEVQLINTSTLSGRLKGVHRIDAAACRTRLLSFPYFVPKL